MQETSIKGEVRHYSITTNQKNAFEMSILGDSLPTQAIGDGTLLAANYLSQRPGLHL